MEQLPKERRKNPENLKDTYGHTPLSERELDFLSLEKPEVVYIGIGHRSALPITPEARSILKAYETVILPTQEVTGRINQEKRKMVALIHVTC